MLRPLISHPADADEVRRYLDRLQREHEEEKRLCEASGDRHGVKTNFTRLNLIREFRERLLGASKTP